MRIIQVHNYYQQAGGEDVVAKAEVDILESNEHNIYEYRKYNSAVSGFFRKAMTGLGAIFNVTELVAFYRFLGNRKFDLVHVHNYFPILSPSIFWACKKRKVPVVQTLHNYRAICPTAILMYEGDITEKSIHGGSWWALKARVYRYSYVGTFFLCCMVELHKALPTWRRKVDRFIALTEFSRRKYIEAGWPPEKIVVKPNFIKDPFDGIDSISKVGGYALFVGRLSEEKGVSCLLKAWEGVETCLKVVGDGPLKELVENYKSDKIDYLGYRKKSEVLELIRNANFLVMPSTWYEGFPMVLVEAFACGTPALVSRLGGMEEIVDDGITGLHFEAGNAEDLFEKIQWMINNPKQTKAMGANARKEYLDKYTPEKNYAVLMDIYKQALDESKRQE